MDNASIHKSARVQELCDIAGLQREDLLLYCPEFNPIEATFGDIKAWIKKNIVSQSYTTVMVDF